MAEGTNGVAFMRAGVAAAGEQDFAAASLRGIRIVIVYSLRFDFPARFPRALRAIFLCSTFRMSEVLPSDCSGCNRLLSCSRWIDEAVSGMQRPASSRLWAAIQKAVFDDETGVCSDAEFFPPRAGRCRDAVCLFDSSPVTMIRERRHCVEREMARGRADRAVATARCRFICRSSCRPVFRGKQLFDWQELGGSLPLDHSSVGQRDQTFFVKLEGEPVTHAQNVSVVFAAIVTPYSARISCQSRSTQARSRREAVQSKITARNGCDMIRDYSKGAGERDRLEIKVGDQRSKAWNDKARIKNSCSAYARILIVIESDVIVQKNSRYRTHHLSRFLWRQPCRLQESRMMPGDTLSLQKSDRWSTESCRSDSADGSEHDVSVISQSILSIILA